MKKILFIIAVLILTISCKQENNKSIQTEVQTFLDEYTNTYTKLYYASAEAEWIANTRIVVGDTINANEVQKANEALAEFTGSTKNIEKTRKFLEHKSEVETVQ